MWGYFPVAEAGYLFTMMDLFIYKALSYDQSEIRFCVAVLTKSSEKSKNFVFIAVNCIMISQCFW